MRKPRRTSLNELVQENIKELISDPDAVSEIEKKLEEKKAKEVFKKKENEAIK
ncbi:FbpB family small basic protein [Alteribacillus iranensis]|uniref:Fur-regulated basic protein B n=1 Tax=Alteribacillus iranensis TaxID=930128 RepID=A0A1I2EXP8_9BACI|nr:FbpB family small basic protein [Alteribacillus iranensis]SFE97559.1 Fur-regulated basic protein B [Alteribacillus iranensis]